MFFMARGGMLRNSQINVHDTQLSHQSEKPRRKQTSWHKSSAQASLITGGRPYSGNLNELKLQNPPVFTIESYESNRLNVSK